MDQVALEFAQSRENANASRPVALGVSMPPVGTFRPRLASGAQVDNLRATGRSGPVPDRQRVTIMEDFQRSGKVGPFSDAAAARVVVDALAPGVPERIALQRMFCSAVVSALWRGRASNVCRSWFH
jgi:hypothetical protein